MKNTRRPEHPIAAHLPARNVNEEGVTNSDAPELMAAGGKWAMSGGLLGGAVRPDAHDLLPMLEPQPLRHAVKNFCADTNRGKQLLHAPMDDVRDSSHVKDFSKPAIERYCGAALEVAAPTNWLHLFWLVVIAVLVLRGLASAIGALKVSRTRERAALDEIGNRLLSKVSTDCVFRPSRRGSEALLFAGLAFEIRASALRQFDLGADPAFKAHQCSGLATTLANGVHLHALLSWGKMREVRPNLPKVVWAQVLARYCAAGCLLNSKTALGAWKTIGVAVLPLLDLCNALVSKPGGQLGSRHAAW